GRDAPTKTSTGGSAAADEPTMPDDVVKPPRRFDRMNAIGESPEALVSALLATSSSSAAGRLRCGPHIWSRRLGGVASIGWRFSTVPSEGTSHESGVWLKPCSSIFAAL